MADETLLAFDSRVNYMKRSSITGQESLALGAFGATTTKVITYPFGGIPVMHVSFEPTGDGTIFPSEKINKYTETSLSGAPLSDPQLTYWFDPTTSTLTIDLINNTATGSRMVYWVLYLDYGNV